jgi:hypothetical protein
MIDTAREDELLRIILEQDDQHKLDLTELASLRKALDDRRTVEGYCSHPRRELSIDPFDKTVMVDEEFVLTPHLFSGETLDEAFSAAAEWVRHQ